MPNGVPAKPDEVVYCWATARAEFKMTGVSKNGTWNYNSLCAWNSGNKHGDPDASGDTKTFYANVRTAGDDAGFEGKRTGFDCAEVNAVVQLLGAGADLKEIELYRPYQKSQLPNYVFACASCKAWIDGLGITVKDRVKP
jgi:hypothetical protein